MLMYNQSTLHQVKKIITEEFRHFQRDTGKFGKDYKNNTRTRKFQYKPRRGKKRTSGTFRKQ